MTGRGQKIYYRQDTGKAITDDEKYMMLMLHQHQKLSLRNIAKKFGISSVQARIIIGKRSGPGCCG
jgi:hypothetical protein